MYPRNTTNAKRGYAARELKRKKARKKAASSWKPINQETTPKEGKMKKSEKIALIAGAILLTALCVGSLIFFGKVLKPAAENFAEFKSQQEPPVVNIYIPTQEFVAIEAPAEPTPAPTEAPPVIPTEAPVVETEEEKSEAILAPDLAIPSAPVAVTTPDPICKDWNPEVKTTQNLLPGQVARGDVVVDGKPYYDDGTGEATVVINLSSNPVKIFSEWGSGCETVTDLRYLISKELVAGCGDPDGDGIVNGCMSVRIVTITDLGISQNFYTEVPK